MQGLAAVMTRAGRRVPGWMVMVGVIITTVCSRGLPPLHDSPIEGQRHQLDQQLRDKKPISPVPPTDHVSQAHHVVGMARPMALHVPLAPFLWPMASYDSYLRAPRPSKPTSRPFTPDDGLTGPPAGVGWTGWPGIGGGGVFGSLPTPLALDLPDIPGGDGDGDQGGGPSSGPGEGAPPPTNGGVIINDGPDILPTSLLTPTPTNPTLQQNPPTPGSGGRPPSPSSYPHQWVQSSVWVWPDDVVTGALPSLQLGAPALPPPARPPPVSPQGGGEGLSLPVIQGPAVSSVLPHHHHGATGPPRGGLPAGTRSLSPLFPGGPGQGLLSPPRSVPFTLPGSSPLQQGGGGWGGGGGGGGLLLPASAPFTLGSSHRQQGASVDLQPARDVTDVTTAVQESSNVTDVITAVQERSNNVTDVMSAIRESGKTVTDVITAVQDSKTVTDVITAVQEKSSKTVTDVMIAAQKSSSNVTAAQTALPGSVSENRAHPGGEQRQQQSVSTARDGAAHRAQQSNRVDDPSAELMNSASDKAGQTD